MTHSDNGRVPIVGIGASAGGIEALEVLFRAMPRDIGAAFVVVTHLNPRHESVLPAILQRFTEIPVTSASDDVEVEAGHIYVMPENVALTIRDGRLRVTRPRPVYRESHPVDLFLAALAMDRNEYAAGIILSGSDGDGTLGTKAIKERGGLTMAQVADGTAPKHPGMPQTAIAAGMIDFAIPAQEMPERLVAFVKGLKTIDSLDPDNGGDEVERLQQLRKDIYGLLEGQLGHDFSGYKTRTFNRRVQRRIQLQGVEGVEAYVALLRRDPSEVAALFRDLLINVTNFFRDAEAFAALKESVVPMLFEGKGRDDTIRIWIPGCATGEEVYSIAILLREQMDERDVSPRVQIFATDIDERSLDVARSARYPEPLLSNVSPERRERYFISEGSSYQVSKEVRELCIFSPHSLIRDPPFSRMDLVSCRNLLIYLAPNLQGQVIPLFHYSLKPKGFLFLGTSENIGQFYELFSPVDKKQRIFRARESASTPLRLPLVSRAHHTDVMAHPPNGSKFSTVQALRHDVDARVIERFAPAHVVVNSEGDVVLYSPRTGKYLEAAAGVPSRQLLAMARRGLRLELRGALREAASERRRVERHDLAVEMDDGRLQMVAILVEPLDIRTEEPLFIVLFSDSGPPLDREQAVVRIVGDQGSVTALERDLIETRERLQSMVEEYETALEELKSSNEELVSVNEELQSTNEELEASKEELQSLNEELQTVNAELGHKIDELDQSNSELRNLFDTSKMATIFVYHDLTIRNFTPLAADIFNLLPSDRGRSLTIFTSPLAYPDFLAHIARTAETGEPVETSVAHEDGQTKYLVRIQPYQSDSGHRDGATVTFLDITDLKT